MTLTVDVNGHPISDIDNSGVQKGPNVRRVYFVSGEGMINIKVSMTELRLLLVRCRLSKLF
jgi:hypothetical protein